jgi:hypothetical protein
VGSIVACKSTPDGTDAAIRQYCDSLLASPAYACCNDADRAQRQFTVRNRYASAADCADQMLRAVSENTGMRAFDPQAASKCLGYLQSRGCNPTPSSAIQIAEEQAGCNRVIVGVQGVGKPCDTSADCQVGLFCPPVKDTGVSACARPAAATEACNGDLPIFEVDHPPCQPGLFCSLIGDKPEGCPTPPCLDYRCVPFYDEGEACTALECGSGTGLACLDGFCRKGAPSQAGGPCRLTEHCADGLFCDPNANGGSCVARKTAGAPCRSTTDPSLVLECKGLCKGPGDGPGVCGAFCGAQ